MVYVLARFSFLFCKQKTAYEMRISDWSSDVCSSDLPAAAATGPAPIAKTVIGHGLRRPPVRTPACSAPDGLRRCTGLDGGKPAGRRGSGSDQIGRASCRASVCQYV